MTALSHRAVRALLPAALALAACGGDAAPPQEVSEPSTSGQAPGVVAPLATPTGQAAAPLVVLVPGGGWTAADPRGLAVLAPPLSSAGATTAMISYRTATDDAYFPVPAQDVACGVAQAAVLATEAGRPPSEVVVVGHSAGAQLAALVALDPQAFTSDDCPYPAVSPDRLVGLAGPYDVVLAADVAASLFGPQRPDPATWDDGNPMLLADRRPDVPVLLVHGTDDTTVPIEFSGAFADALEAGGHDVTRAWLEGVDHQSVYQADVALPVLVDWLGLGEAGVG